MDGHRQLTLDIRPLLKYSAQDFVNSRAIIYAVRPFGWKERFPKASRTDRELRERIVEKYRSLLPSMGLIL